MTPGNRLKKAREMLGLTQAQLGEPLGFKWTKVKDIEIGKQKLTPEIALQIEKKFSIPFEWLLDGRGGMTANIVQEIGVYHALGKASGAFDLITAKINIMLADMTDEQKRDVLKYTEEKKLLTELIAERKAKE